MALKNVSTAATASAKSAATSTANAAPANAGAPDSALAVIAANFLSVLTGFGAQGTPTPPAGPAKSKDDTAPAAAAPPVPTGGAGALTTALLAAAQSAPAPVATPAPQPSPAASITAIPIGSTPGASTPSVMPLANMAADATSPGNATSAVPPPAVTPPTVMPAAAVPVTQAASSNAPAAANKSSAPSSAAKPGNPPSAAPSNDVAPDGGDVIPTPAAPANPSSDVWLLPPGIRLPTLQAAVTGPSVAASTAMSAGSTSDSEEGDPASDSTDTSESSLTSTEPAVKSVTDPVAFALSADATTSITQSNSTASTSADSMPSAAAAAAQAAPMHNTAHMQIATDTRGPTELRSPVGTAAWTEELGTQLTWMSRHGQDSASLRLSPDHLGPVEVRIEVRDGATSVWFGAAHADTRSALEQSLPRLRELFAASGLLLADAGVARDAPRQNTRPGAPISLGGSSNEPAITTSKVSPASTHSGLVDTYV
jgi:flagellar hook-length control protein FliK